MDTRTAMNPYHIMNTDTRYSPYIHVCKYTPQEQLTFAFISAACNLLYIYTADEDHIVQSCYQSDFTVIIVQLIMIYLRTY